MPLPQNFFNHDAQAGGFFPLAHVGIPVEGIGNRQNTLIEGIRGTGKTHILRMINRYHLGQFSTQRILPVYVSLAEISEHMKKDADEFRIQLYARIVSTTIETLEANKHHLSPNRGVVTGAVRLMLRALGLDEVLGVENIDKSIDEVKHLADELLFKLSYDLTAADLRSQGNSGAVLRGGFGGGAEASAKANGVGSGKASTSVNGSAEMSESRMTDDTIKILGSHLAHRNAAQFIITFLQQVQVILDLEYTLILLDECSEAGRDAQVEIFRFFKAIRGANSIHGKDDCAFFVGSVYPSGETYYPNRAADGFSFEPGQDCGVEFIQWDETDPESYIAFFEQMLIARARAVIGYEGNIAKFISKYYEDRRTFNLLAYCAGGTPRRFWELNKRAYDSGTDQVSYSRLKIAIQEVVNEQILGHSSLTEPDHKLAQHIIGVLTISNEAARIFSKNNHPKKMPQGIYFSINRANSVHLGRLVMQGAIYDKSRMKSRRQSLRPHPIYALDTGVAFSNRVIPERGFDLVAERDFPLSTENGFASAASFEPPNSKSGKQWTIEDVFNARGVTSPTLPPKIQGPVRLHGVIKQILPSGNAFASVSDGGPNVFISRKDMLGLSKLGGVKGSPIEMLVTPNAKGRQASEIMLLTLEPLSKKDKLQKDIKAYVESIVAEHKSLPLARIGNDIRNHFGDELGDDGWMGYAKFSQFLTSLGMERVRIDLETSPGFAREK